MGTEEYRDHGEAIFFFGFVSGDFGLSLRVGLV